MSKMTLRCLNKKMGAKEKRKKNKKKLVWVLTKPNFFWAFQHLAQDPVGPIIRTSKAQAQDAMHTRNPELPELNEQFLLSQTLI